MTFNVGWVSCVSLTTVSYGCALPTLSTATSTSLLTVGFLNGGVASIVGASLVLTDSNAIVTSTPLATILPSTELKHSITLAYNGARRVEYVKLSVVDGSATALAAQTILCQWNDRSGAQFTRTDENGPSSGNKCGVMCILTIVMAGVSALIGVAAVIYGFNVGHGVGAAARMGHFHDNIFIPPDVTPHEWIDFPITLPFSANGPSIETSISRLLVRRV